MKNKLNLILSASYHLPSGSGEADFECLYNNEIKPLVSALDKFPDINVGLYYSGVILYWIERRHPELFMLLEDLQSRKQIEFFGGGFYNPVLPLLPMADKIGQIEMLTTYLRKHFGKRPQGCWLPANAWEQNLVGPLTSSGMSYTFLEDRFFSGADEKNGRGVFFPCITEDQGKLITVFPVAESLGRELRNSRSVKDPAELLKKISPPGEQKNRDSLVVLIPVGGCGYGTDPAFQAAGAGGPPPPAKNSAETAEGTRDFEKLFESLSGAGKLADFTLPAKVLKNCGQLKKLYFSFAGMPGAGSGVHPRQFLADHSVADNIYAKMVYVHTLINNQLRGDKTRKRTALEELWKAQDSGIFCLGSAASPGLLHPPVRKAAYRSLLEAEKIAREKGKFSPSLSIFDFDLDGEGEYIFQDEKLNCYVKSRGAGIFELDYLPAAWNYLDTLALEKTPKEGKPRNGGSERRCAFVEWLAPVSTRPEDIGSGGIREGRFCGAEEYEAGETDRVRRRQTFKLGPKTDLPWGELEIEKTWQLKKNSLALEYVLRNTGNRNQRFMFCPHMDLSFPGEGEAFLRVLSQKEDGKENISIKDAVTIRDTKALEFQDIKNETVITLEASRSFEGRIFQIHAGLPGREEYQSTCVVPVLPVSMDSGKTWKATFSLKISS